MELESSGEEAIAKVRVHSQRLFRSKQKLIKACITCYGIKVSL